jgi:hypothetical protein
VEQQRSFARPVAMRGRSPVLAVAFLIGWMALAFARPATTVACSCAMPDHPMRDAAASPDLSVFSGVAGPLEGNGVRVALTRWFRGIPPPTGIAVLDPAGFVDPNGGSCGTNPPGAGEEWIFALGRNAVGRYDMSLCSTAAATTTDLGRDLLAEATAVFGPGLQPVATAPPGGSTTPSDDPLSTIGSMAIPVVFFAAAIGVVGTYLILRGRRRDGGSLG